MGGEEEWAAAVMCFGCAALTVAAVAMVAVWPGDAEAVAIGLAASLYLWYVCNGVAAFIMLVDKN